MNTTLKEVYAAYIKEMIKRDRYTEILGYVEYVETWFPTWDPKEAK